MSSRSKTATNELNNQRESQTRLVQANHDSLGIKNIWQTPYVDVFKHFNVLPFTFGETIKKKGHVTEENAVEIGRKCLSITGDLAVNNYLQIPNLEPGSGCQLKSLGLVGRYIYLQGKTLNSTTPFTFNFDLKMAVISKCVRLSASNLFKSLNVINDFVIQIPLNLEVNRWTVIVFDIYQILLLSGILPPDYLIANNFEVKQITITSSCSVRGVYTSDNLYDFVTLPQDMRFKTQFDISKWPLHFAWLQVPDDIIQNQDLDLQRSEQIRAKAALVSSNKNVMLSQQQKEKMQQEITDILQVGNDKKIQEMTTHKSSMKKGYKDSQVHDSLIESGGVGLTMQSPEGHRSVTSYKMHNTFQKAGLNLKEFQNGYFIGQEQRKSELLMKEPVLELKRIIGYTPESCLNIKWSTFRRGDQSEKVVLYTSSTTLIAMDAETQVQNRFFFGHTQPICCFDMSQNGIYVASAQQRTEGANGQMQSFVRIWDYHNANCRSYITLPVEELKCVSFSPDTNFLAVVGVEKQYWKSGNVQKERKKIMIIIYDISQIGKQGCTPMVFAKQISDFDIQCIKFSPVDSTKLFSCGKQNIRFWKIKETRNIRGTGVVLNHYSRDPNSEFTSLDFGCRKQCQQNEEIKHIYVASNFGTIFQIGYDSQLLEQTYKNITSPVLSISVNDFFCACGSEDSFLRMQYLDFCDFPVTATHESAAVCSVEISPDGQRVLWGTKRGDLLLYDRSNSALKIIMNSHTKAIVAMDVLRKTGNIITASDDYSIRIWDQKSQIYEYSCLQSNENPLCIAAHPSLPVFSCGFESGSLRIFDIEHIEGKKERESISAVGLDFFEFKKPIRKLAYSPNGELLITCCEDGSVSFHNANRQYLLMKKLVLEFPPENVHVAFSPITRSKQIKALKYQGDGYPSKSQFTNDLPDENIDSSNHSKIDMEYQTVEQTESYFGLMGEHGNNVMIYDTESYLLRNQIQVGHIVKLFQFANSQEIIIVTKDQKIKFYNLSKFLGVQLREIATVHREEITSTSISNNRGFLLTGGKDNLIKIWDYQAQSAVPYWFQSYIGHTKPIVNAFFSPINTKQIFSTASTDGIFIWDFNGDDSIDFNPQPTESESQPGEEQVRFFQNKNLLHQPSALERMRETVAEFKKIRYPEFCFLVGEMMEIPMCDKILPSFAYDTNPLIDQIQAFVDQEQQKNELPYTHFVSVKDFIGMQEIILELPSLAFIETNTSLKIPDVKSSPDKKSKASKVEDSKEVLDPALLRLPFELAPHIVGGYDGFSGAHENLKWVAKEDLIIYSMNNKIILEKTKTKEQQIINLSSVRLSTMAMTDNQQFIAIGEGEMNSKGSSLIHILDMGLTGKDANLGPKNIVKTLIGHTHGIQSMVFKSSKYLFSLSVAQEKSVSVWDVQSEELLVTQELPCQPGNCLVINKNQWNDKQIIFYVLGGRGLILKFTFNIAHDNDQKPIYDLQFEDLLPKCEPDKCEGLITCDFVSGTITEEISIDGQLTSILVIGTSDGCLVAFNTRTETFHQNGKKYPLTEGQIGQIKITKEYVVIATKQGQIMRYNLTTNIFPTERASDQKISMKLEGGIISLELTADCVEGVVGTNSSVIYYINLNEKLQQKFVTRISQTIDSPAICQFDPSNPLIFMASTGANKGQFKLFSNNMLDEVQKFDMHGCGRLVFIESMFKKSNRLNMVGYKDGTIKFIEFKEFTTKDIFKFELKKDEELTCGTWSRNDINFAVGTSFGEIFLCSYNFSKLNPGNQVVKAIRLDKVASTQEFSITSILLSLFNPDGYMIAAFSSGEIRTWKSQIRNKEIAKKYDKSDCSVEVEALGEFVFNVYETYDLIEEAGQFPYELEDKQNCQISFMPSNSPNPQASTKNAGFYNTYIAMHSSVPYVFIRNHQNRNSTQKIDLHGHHPLSFDCLPNQAVSDHFTVNSKSFNMLLTVGTKEGIVYVHYITSEKNSKFCGKSKPGEMFGEVTAVALNPTNGDRVYALSSNSEIMCFHISHCFATAI